MIATAYPTLGKVTLIDPNQDKLDRARPRIEKVLHDGSVDVVCAALGDDASLPRDAASLVTVGSVLMPMMEFHQGTLGASRKWLRQALGEIKAMTKPGASVFLVETLALLWSQGDDNSPSRRLQMDEFLAELQRAELTAVECVYRFRDRVVLRILR